MIQKILTPKDSLVNLSFEIPKKFIGKSLKISIAFEKENDSQNQMSAEEFQQWIHEAENAPKMSLDTFRKKWKQETLKIQQLIP